MPRLPVDGKKVQELRITFGTKEREMIESAVTGYSFNRVATPTVSLLSDVSALTAFAGLLEMTGIIDVSGWIKENTWFDEIYAGILAGAYATYEEMMAAANAAKDLYNEGLEIVEDFAEDPLGEVAERSGVWGSKAEIPLHVKAFMFVNGMKAELVKLKQNEVPAWMPFL